MTKTLETTSMFGTKVTITFEDNYDYILWGNEVTIVKSFDKLPKTDTAYNVLKDFKGATSVMATYKGNYKKCVIYERKSPRCSNWAVHYCNMNQNKEVMDAMGGWKETSLGLLHEGLWRTNNFRDFEDIVGGTLLSS